MTTDEGSRAFYYNQQECGCLRQAATSISNCLGGKQVLALEAPRRKQQRSGIRILCLARYHDQVRRDRDQQMYRRRR